jgi:hypothetical protein
MYDTLVNKGYKSSQVKHPCDMKWQNVLMANEVMKEMINIRGEYVEIETEIKNAKELIESIYIKSKMEWRNYKWE